MAGMELPFRAIRQQIASAVDVIIQLARLRDGSRRVTSITELLGMEGDMVTMQEIFALEMKGLGPDGRLVTVMRSTGVRPRVMDRLRELGLPVPAPLAVLFPTRGAA
jgi:pilus assembly protein CpaF